MEFLVPKFLWDFSECIGGGAVKGSALFAKVLRQSCRAHDFELQCYARARQQ